MPFINRKMIVRGALDQRLRSRHYIVYTRSVLCSFAIFTSSLICVAEF